MPGDQNTEESSLIARNTDPIPGNPLARVPSSSLCTAHVCLNPNRMARPCVSHEMIINPLGLQRPSRTSAWCCQLQPVLVEASLRVYYLDCKVVFNTKHQVDTSRPQRSNLVLNIIMPIDDAYWVSCILRFSKHDSWRYAVGRPPKISRGCRQNLSRTRHVQLEAYDDAIVAK